MPDTTGYGSYVECGQAAVVRHGEEKGEYIIGMYLDNLPAIIVQGRRDLVCPPATAYTLAERWLGAQLRMIEDGGHSAMHPAVGRALVQDTQDMKERLTAP